MEVGFALLGRSLSELVVTHPSLVEPSLANLALAKKTSSEKDNYDLRTLHLHIFLNFLSHLQKQYRDLPYHNSIHGAHVAHAMACLQEFLELDKG